MRCYAHAKKILCERIRRCIYEAFLRGTLAPFFRASESPMAMACFRLFTCPPLPPLPDLSVPRFFRRMALATVLLAAFPYLGELELLRDLDFFAGVM